MATDLEKFVSGVLPHVPGCPESLAINMIRRAVIRLCEDSTIWRDDIPAGDIDIDVADYTITPPADTRIIALMSLMYDGVEMTKRTEEWLDVNDSSWRNSNPGSPTSIVNYAPDRFILNRVPTKTIVGGMVSRVILKPTNDALVCGDLIYNDWSEAVEHGAISLLMEIPEKKWSDMNLSMYHGRQFNFQIQRARARATMGFAKKSTTAQMQSW